jgi:hypothetical protein
MVEGIEAILWIGSDVLVLRLLRRRFAILEDCLRAAEEADISAIDAEEGLDG